MKPQFQHEATTSFALWLDNYFIRQGEGFSNKEGELYYKPDERLPVYPEDPILGLASYNSEYKQWVCNNDATAEGAIVPSGVYIDTGAGYDFCHRGESGVNVDFENGRVLVSGFYFPEIYDKLKIKAQFSVKDINVYLTDDVEENLVLQNKYNVNSRTVPDLGKGQGLEPYEQVAPAAFVSMERTVNTPFALGGEDLTHLYYRVVIFAENLYQLDGAMALCADAYNAGICNIGYDDYPLNEFGDTKDYYFSYYETAKNSEKVPKLMFVDDVKSSKISDRLSKTTNPNLFLGFIDFEVCQSRFTRRCFPPAPPPPPPPCIGKEKDRPKDTYIAATNLCEDAEAGTTTLIPCDQSIFQLGDEISIAPGMPIEEKRIVTGFGSIIVDIPTLNFHKKGTLVYVLRRNAQGSGPQGSGPQGSGPQGSGPQSSF